ncbi:hypothetical protein [Flavobacterium pedocola]
MNKKDLLIGFIIGLVSATLGCLLFLFFFTKIRSVEALQTIRDYGYMGKLITLGAIFNIIAFFYLLNKDKEVMARGVILATIVLAILTVIL